MPLHQSSKKSPMAALVTMITRNDGMLDRVIAEHQRTDRGRCSCSTLNVPRDWPCTTYIAAMQAAEHMQLVARAG